MSDDLRRPLVARLAVGLLLVCLLVARPGFAQQPKSDAIDRAKQAMKEAMQRIAVPKSRLTNGPHVRAAFRQVVAKPSRSTVRVKADGRDVALGTIVGRDGWLLTKSSELNEPITCRLKDGREFPACVVGVHQEFDLAMLKIEASELPVIEWRKSPPLVGQWVATLGLDKDPVAVGVISVEARPIPKRSGILGVLLDQAESGPRIIQVLPESGAAKAGLQVNDIVTHLNGKQTSSRETLVKAVRQHGPGDQIELTIRRDDKPMKIHARLTEAVHGLRPDRRDVQNSMGSKLSKRRDGFPSVLQHDTVLRPVDCGGAIVDLEGRVVGINLARGGRTESYAVPAEIVLEMLGDLMSGKLAPPTADESEEASKPTPKMEKTHYEGQPPEPE